MNDALDPTLLAEREHLDKSRVALGHMRQRTEAIGDNAGDELTAFALGRLRRQRLADLADRPDTPLFFGRLRWSAEDYHIGRRHVVDGGGNPMVLDWRAPLSRTFYQASVRNPMDVRLRRRFGFDGGDLTSFEDEHLDAGDEKGESSQILATEIERPRVGPMRDIVATIQPEQDDLVRADLATTICVQGAPGTGKTAVGLHRAAFLLYAFREQLKRSGVLIVGPNTAFMSYIDNVLPTLGEVDVTQLAVDELTDTVAVRGEDPIEVARLKHDVRMAEVLRRAVWGHVTVPEDSLMIAEGSWRWRLGTEYLRRAVSEALADDIPYLTGRERVRAQIVAGLRRQVELRSGDSPGEAWTRRMGRHKPVTAFLDEIWPELDPKRLLARMLTDADYRARVCEGILSQDEQDLLASRTKNPRYSRADAVLIDEIAGLLERPGGFGHVVVDEAQDLSAMQCRAIARRSTHGSITVLGDLAQGTSPWTAADWAQSLAHLGKPEGEIVALTTGFRVPADVLELANRLLPSLDVDVPEARSLRSDGLLEIDESSDLETDVAAAVDRALSWEGSIGVIAADAAIEKLRARLGDNDRVELVPATLAKGLEFDHVIVAEPADIVAAEPLGLRRLYVVLTRAVSRLTVVHTKPLPPQLSS
ncbi:HelD family protein [Stackebrandtia nassauensis]|uniref:Superfamily I DNA and RNA helicase-like protein n=1 Tax=Stackebrandtia nassauensis (strain DSM 44728 / CIP 108903 / NRRL B-16338 / NBRC 102104 / LLR-40K-21) TaxID=446470 RepID=D3QBB7_STANL|nr:ATP-binding domain-containing protein [Stackebrandtia nassauensis]ADD40934.1 Superfamily I DNA and RNA helicase-like protein [Stackebrandtia nassauensis DSM 44728]